MPSIAEIKAPIWFVEVFQHAGLLSTRRRKGTSRDGSWTWWTLPSNSVGNINIKHWSSTLPGIINALCIVTHNGPVPTTTSTDLLSGPLWQKGRKPTSRLLLIYVALAGTCLLFSPSLILVSVVFMSVAAPLSSRLFLIFL